MHIVDHDKPIIEVIDLKNKIGNQWVHKGLNFSIDRGEIIAIIGSSGCGKTTLLRSILMLRQPTSGTINVFDTDVVTCGDKAAMAVQRRWGVMFQSLALFSSLQVWENIVFPVRQFSMLKKSTQKELALLKLKLVGLKEQDAGKMPSELSGGMAKRAALARTIVLDPELVFLDEPSSGLDPVSARLFDDLIKELRNLLGITFVMVTHDVDTLRRATDRVLFLGEGEVIDFAPVDELSKNPHPLIQEYFYGAHIKEMNYPNSKEEV
ncbi:MAG: ATP-binding cassette domain-containing protein [Coxiellaceae bacterium]|nr:ATP-binding cassette domain-containing protein [Coxiellaceae bacterium]